ncbi:MAG: recombinase family protein [Burkholderiales bacterium]|jgi:putative resolvase
MKSTMSTGKAANLLGVSVKTLQRWERKARLIPIARTDSNRRLYTEAQIREFIGLRHVESEPTRLVAYCRVSSAAQKPDLAHQRKVLEKFVMAKGLSNVEFIEEVGGGLDFKRKRFLVSPEQEMVQDLMTIVHCFSSRLYGHLPRKPSGGDRGLERERHAGERKARPSHQRRGFWDVPLAD